MVTRTRSDWMAKIAEALTGEAPPRRQSEHVRDLRGMKNPVASRKTKDQSRLKPREKAQESPEQYRKALLMLSRQHQQKWGSQ